MQSNEQAAQALILDLSNFEVIQEVKKGSKKSPYDALFAFIPKMEVGQIYKLTEEFNWKEERTFIQNRQNLAFHISKAEKLKGYSLAFMELQTKAVPATENAPEIPSYKVAAFKLLKKPAETAPIPVNVNNGQPVQIPTEETKAELPEATKAELPEVPTEEKES